MSDRGIITAFRERLLHRAELNLALYERTVEALKEEHAHRELCFGMEQELVRQRGKVRQLRSMLDRQRTTNPA